MATTVTTNSSVTEGGVNAGHVAFVEARGTWDGATATVKTKSNGTYTAYASDATQTADFARYYQLGSESGVQVQFTGVGANTSVTVDIVDLG